MPKPEDAHRGTIDIKFERIHSLGSEPYRVFDADSDIFNGKALNGGGGNTTHGILLKALHQSQFH